MLDRQTVSGDCLQAGPKAALVQVSSRETCLLFLVFCLGSKHLVETGGSEPSGGVEKQDVLLEAQRHTGCNAQAHLERQGPGISQLPQVLLLHGPEGIISTLPSRLRPTHLRLPTAWCPHELRHFPCVQPGVQQLVQAVG